MALTSRMSAASAAANQARNCSIGFGWRSARRRPCASYSWRSALSSVIGVSSITGNAERYLKTADKSKRDCARAVLVNAHDGGDGQVDEQFVGVAPSQSDA